MHEEPGRTARSHTRCDAGRGPRLCPRRVFMKLRESGMLSGMDKGHIGFLLLLIGLAACGSDVDDRPVTWSYIHPAIIVPNCATSGCHSALTMTFGYNFEDKEGARDVFIQDVQAPALFLGTFKQDNGVYQYQMPPDQPLPQADIDLISRWLNTPGQPE